MAQLRMRRHAAEVPVLQLRAALGVQRVAGVLGPSRPGPRALARITIIDVAALAGVSKSAVSKVFNNRPGISEPTRERILDGARKLGWSPSASATLLGANAPARSAVVSRAPDLLTTDPYRLHMPGLMVGRAWDDRSTASGIVESLHAEGQMEAVTAAVDHLVALGHQSIASVAEPEDRVHNVLRRRALEHALARHGPRPHAVLTGEFGNAAADRATSALFRSPNRRPRCCMPTTQWL
ncbi:LacI family DNA-binding transcriptional regulator [Streptomyces sp. NPDC056337]|uniref:LacI family DNA-binding transcriptional regulator n=1 Tax=Streptomyces sp. NPDC056337 TaxID=3345787 RepID=UPI0035E0BB6B